MELHPVPTRLTPGEGRIGAELRGAGEVLHFEIGVPAELAGHLSPHLDPFLPPAVVLAAALGKDLEICGTVSAKLLEGSRQAATILAAWCSWRVPRLLLEGRAVLGVPSRETGLFFTRGLDSSAILAAWQLDPRLRPDRLIGVHGLAPSGFADHEALLLADTARAALRRGYPLVPIRTNARPVLEPFVDWKFSHGAILAGAGLALGPLFGRLVLASTNHAAFLSPSGSHPALDPLWSTESTAVLHEGVELTRTDKARLVGPDGDAMGELKVCWEAATRANCGRCIKCGMTLTNFAAAGHLSACVNFEAPLSLEAIAAADPRHCAGVEETYFMIPEEQVELRRVWAQKVAERRALESSDRC